MSADVVSASYSLCQSWVGVGEVDLAFPNSLPSQVDNLFRALLNPSNVGLPLF